jgi:ribosome maturation factor RimP
MTLKDTLSQIITEKIITNPEIFLVEVIVADKVKKKIMVLLDGDKGVDIDECAKVSRQLGEIIEAENIIEDAYLLEVSSPGLDFPLKLQRQYVANIGRNLKVETSSGVFNGIIKEVSETGIILEIAIKKSKTQLKKDLAAGIEPENPMKQIAFTDIKKALVQVAE